MNIYHYAISGVCKKRLIRDSLSDFFNHNLNNDDILHFSFDGVDGGFDDEIDIVKLIVDACDNTQIDFIDYINGANHKFKLTLSFSNTVFKAYASFKNLRCHKLSFDDTVFEKGVNFGHIDADEIIFKPRKLGAGATFYHRKKVDSEEDALRGEYKGRIGALEFRHALEGDGKTFFVGAIFEKKAEFMNAVLDKVVFSHIEEDSMSKCFFANSFIENTEFYNCIFPLKPNIGSVLDKHYWYKSNLMLFVQMFFAPIGLVAMITMGKNDDFALIFSWLIAFGLFVWVGVLNLTFMPLMYFLEKITNFIFKGSKLNNHMATADDYKILAADDIHTAKLNSATVREVYRQLKVNFERHGDYQMAGEFYYSQRYCEIIGFGGIFSKQFLQTILMHILHWLNGFGERWLRAIVWFWLILLGFSFLYHANEDFISTKSTPEYFLNAYLDTYYKSPVPTDNTIAALRFDGGSTAKYSDELEKKHFMLLSSVKNRKDEQNKTIFAYDNRFDYYYAEQYIPVLNGNKLSLYIAHSLSKMIAPFVSEEKKWFQDRSERAYYLGFLETILLWIFFLAFVFAVKNRIRR